MPGVLLVVAGAWVLCQVLGGNALGRLGVIAQAPTTVDDVVSAVGGGL
jgi:hypothetical protein